MAAVPTCPAAKVLKQFALGELTAEEITAVQQHLGVCSQCLAVLQALETDDTLARDLRKAAAAEMPGPEREQVAGIIKKLRPLGPGNTTARLPADGPPPAAAPGSDAFAGLLAPPLVPGALGRLGPYRVRRLIGEGGMGWVFEGFDPNLRRKVALKVMKPELAADAEFRARFLREGQAAAALKNDHIVTVYQVGEEGGTLFLAMEFLEGESLERRLRHGGEVSTAEVLRVGREVAEGLAAAHERGLVHRDIKPGNLWLEAAAGAAPRGPAPARRVKILDFGLVRLPAARRPLTTLGTRMGTPAYMAPEQAEGLADARSDLFSLGCVLYQMCCGRPPFAAVAAEVPDTGAARPPRPVHEIKPDVRSPLADLIMRLLNRDPARRPASADEVARELRAMEVRRSKTLLLPARTRAQPTELAPPGSPGAARRPDAGMAVPAADEADRYAGEDDLQASADALLPAAGPKEPGEQGGAAAAEPAQGLAQRGSGRPDRLTRSLLVLGLVALLVLSFSPNIPLYSSGADRVADSTFIHAPPLAWFATSVLVYSAVNVVLVFAARIASETQDPRLVDPVIAAVSCAALAWGLVAVFWLLALLWKLLVVAAALRAGAADARHPQNGPVGAGAGLFLALPAALVVVGAFGGLALGRKRPCWLATAVGVGLFLSILLVGFSVQPWSGEPWIAWGR